MAPYATASNRAREHGLSAPNSALRVFEARAVLEFSSLFAAAPLLASQPRGDGRRVVVMPGFGADDASTWPLRQYLNALGYRAYGWGIGRNGGDPEGDAIRVGERVDELHARDEPVTLIGWSLGGVVARLIARNQTHQVREVITLGTPVEGGPKYTSVGSIFAASKGIDLDQFEHHVHRINSEGLSTPLTVIYSRSDAIVGWQAAIDRYNAHARHVEVPSSHIGLGVNPIVWRVIARTLGRKASQAA